MKKCMKCFIMVLLSLSVTSLGWAQCISRKQYANPNRETWVNHLTDTMSTVGKNSQQSARIKEQRRRTRRVNRQKSINAARHKTLQACLARQRQQIDQSNMP